MSDQVSKDNLIQGINILFSTIREKITDQSDVTWTGYDAPIQMRNELDLLVAQLNKEHTKALEDLNSLFLPTGPLQEHSMSNGWSDEYIHLSKEFDRLYKAVKESL